MNIKEKNHTIKRSVNITHEYKNLSNKLHKKKRFCIIINHKANRHIMFKES